MALKISNNSLFVKHFISVDSAGVRYYDNGLLGGTRRAAFSQIDCILLSPDHKLSIQMGRQIYTIQIKPENRKHQAVIDVLLQEVRRSAELPAKI